MPSPFPMENDENYDPNVDIDRGIEDRLFPVVTVVTYDPTVMSLEEMFWDCFKHKYNSKPDWFWNPQDI